MPNIKYELNPGYYYHVFNRANGSELIFKNKENYSFFISKYIQHIHRFVDTFCYCLMPNHFHFLIRIKEKKDIFNFLAQADPQGFENLAGLTAQKLISNQFSKFFNSYAKAFKQTTFTKGKCFYEKL